MREETRRRLARTLWLERLKWIAGGAAVLLFVAAGMWFTGLDASVETHHVAGVVEKIGPLNTTSTAAVEQGLSVEVKLDDGRHANVMVLKASDPHVGDHVEIAEHRHGSGRVTFSWK